jgi:hypothetical protein
MTSRIDARKVIDLLDLAPHREGGWFRQTFADETGNGRPHSTAIYYLLEAGQRSHWHRIDAAEAWHWYAGAPLELKIHSGEARAASSVMILGNDLAGEHRPQAIVPVMHWQSARSLGNWSLAGCTVAPGFEFDGFELAPEGWAPG